MNPFSEMGQRIREARKNRGMTQGDLAEQVHVTRSAVAQWETGRAGQVTTHLTAIAEVLQVGVEYLLHGPASRAPASAASADEVAMLRLYRECASEDRQFLLRTARRLARIAR
ncbi:MAG: helix-turn-helix transcriptional regulator [Rhodospirillales bacterium]|nr:helix-turn-helix transcriptional regulator [Rhodospirillales bacterium]